MENKFRKKNSLNHSRCGQSAARGLAALLMVPVVAVVMAASAGCGSETATISSRDLESGKVLLTQEYVQQVAENSQGNGMVVREARISGEGNEKTVVVGVERPPSVQDASVTGVMASYGQHVFNSLFAIPEVAEVTITMYGVKQGVKSDDVAVRITLGRADAQEVDWSMFGPMMIADMVSDYYVDPAIESSGYSAG